MSAHNNLLDLMSQITHLESNISSIIMEFATKLASLTDLHMLLVLENRDGRKLCGSPHLIDAYAKGSLRSSNGDQLVDVESKTHRNLHSVVDPINDPHQPVILEDDAEVTTFDPYINSLVNSTVLTEPVDVKPNLKRRFGTSVVGFSTPSSRKRSRGGGEIASDGNGSDFTVNHLNDASSGAEMVCIPDDDQTNDQNEEQTSGSRRFQEHLFRPDDEEEVLLDFSELNLPQMKIDFLQKVENPLSLFEKGSVEFRLMNSLLYDFGKSLAYASPYPPESPQSKLFFFQNLQKFIEMFPCFKSDLLSNIKIDSKTPIANLRMNARAGFKRAVLQRKKLMDK